MQDLLNDPWVVEQIELAVAPYVGRVRDSELAWMREQIALSIAEDEHVAARVRRAIPALVEQSGEVRRSSSKAAAQTKKQAG